jgi:hypothetical protein
LHKQLVNSKFKLLIYYFFVNSIALGPVPLTKLELVIIKSNRLSYYKLKFLF